MDDAHHRSGWQPSEMKGYLDTSTTSVTTVTVSGLPSAAYDVYVYADGDNREFARTAAYQISGVGITATTVTRPIPLGANFDTAFVQAANSIGNYMRFSITGSGFTLTATPGVGGNATRRAPINGIQIVLDVPERPGPRDSQHNSRGGIPPRCVARRLQIPDLRAPRALRSGRRAWTARHELRGRDTRFRQPLNFEGGPAAHVRRIRDDLEHTTTTPTITGSCPSDAGQNRLECCARCAALSRRPPSID